jgi:hypothetical protein
VTEIRISGDPDDVTRIGIMIAGIPGIDVKSASGPRDNRKDLGVRMYMNVELAEKDEGK